MTTVASIITDAYRASNLIPLGATPNDLQIAEALSKLNQIVLSSVGNEIGEELKELSYGGEHSQSFLTTKYIPTNYRVILDLTAPVTLKLHPRPYEGQRIAISDVGGNLSTNTLTIDGNGRNIEGAATLVLSTDGLAQQWLYRSDTSNWVKITSLIETDAIPFPAEFDEYFILTLALKINPMYGQEMASEIVASLRRTRSQLRARYRHIRKVYPDYAGRLGDKRYWRGQFGDNFDSGYRWI